MKQTSTSQAPKPAGGYLKPLLAQSCVLPIHFVTGAVFGQTAGMLPQLMAKDSLIPITPDEATWITSIAMMGTVITSCGCGILADKFGRLRMAQICYFFSGLGYALIAAAHSVSLLVGGRFLLGLGGGFSFTALIYTAEITPQHLRGLFLSFRPLLASIGVVFMYTFGSYYPWYVASTALALLNFVGFFYTFMFYDSPQWLVEKKRPKAALKSLKRLEYDANGVEEKLKLLQEIAANKTENSSLTFKLFLQPTVWKPFATLMVLAILQNLGGYMILVSYTVLYLEEFNTTFDPRQITVIFGVVGSISMTLTSFLLRRVSRKMIGTFSGISSAVILVIIFIYLILEKEYPIFSEKHSWIPVSSLAVLILANSLGVYPLPWMLPYEVFPLKVRGIMCGISFGMMYIYAFINTKFYFKMLDVMGLRGMILMFAVSCFSFGVFCKTVLIETHKKSLDEIEREFRGSKQQGGKPRYSDFEKNAQESLIEPSNQNPQIIPAQARS